MPSHKNPIPPDRTAFAPYNFVPLPDTVVPAEQQPDHDKYEGLTGHFLVRLTTQSPTYIRGLLTIPEYELQEQGKDIDGNPVGTETPFRKLVKNKPEFAHYGRENQPVIPGSSLRGMIRTLFEIVTFSKVQPVSDATRMFFRAVAAPQNDPLKQPYQDVITNNATNIDVGYLEWDDGWYVRPAKFANQVDSSLSGDRYLKIRKDAIDAYRSVQILLSNYVGLDQANYKPQYYEVTFEVGRIRYINKEKETKTPISANKIGTTADGLTHKGTLVATGNMLETSDGSKPSPRMNVYLVPEASDEPRIKIGNQAVLDYVAALTPFQKETPFSPTDGVLREGRPIFYVPPQKAGGEIIHFGHTPNFRIAYLKSENGLVRATTPQDFVPKKLRNEDLLDFTEAIFGFIRSGAHRQKKGWKQGDKRAAFSSRVSFTDARLLGRQSRIFFIQEGDNTLIPRILATPKPTSFQLYLVQSDEQKDNLRHYGSSIKNTTIRGHKLYWHRGQMTKGNLEPTEKDPGMENGHPKVNSTQYTQTKPLRSDLTFEFKLYFSNLSEIELGALAWVLSLPENHAHKIGMGKPLGMGSVLLHNIELQIDNACNRYQHLFEEDTWAQPQIMAKTVEAYKELFEGHMQTVLSVTDFKSIPRIQMLLKLLHCWEQSDSWLAATQYMKINPVDGEEDQYKNRAILPDPKDVITKHNPQPCQPSLPPPERFVERESKQLEGIVQYFGKRAGGIQSDSGEGIVKIHKRDLSSGMDTLHEGQRVRFMAVQEGDEWRAYDVEIIQD